MNTSIAYFASTAIGLLTLLAAFAAVTLRNPIHCGLSLALSFMGLAALFIFLGAEFVGFIQILVYVGAVAVLIMFVILLTRPDAAAAGYTEKSALGRLILNFVMAALPAIIVAELAGRMQGIAAPGHATILAGSMVFILALLLIRRLPAGSTMGLAVALSVFAILAVAIQGSPSLHGVEALAVAEVPIAAVGIMLVESHLLPLLITGILLTAALLGAVLFATSED